MDIKRVEAGLRYPARTDPPGGDRGLHSQGGVIKQREAALRTAELNRGYTKIYAPVDGYVSKRSVETGNQVQAGQPLMALVPLRGNMDHGKLQGDSARKGTAGPKGDDSGRHLSGQEFKGKVDSIMAGTGSAFALFPPENATGNYVKVVQRVPVKITARSGDRPGPSPAGRNVRDPDDLSGVKGRTAQDRP